MAGVGKAPKDAEDRARRNVPTRGDWQAAAVAGWQHGPIPTPPAKLLKSTREVWATWFGAWYAAHWRPENVPQIAQVIRLYDAVARGKLERASELRLAMDGIGTTFKGWQDRRWTPPKEEATTGAGPDAGPEQSPADERPTGTYGHLRSVG